jgi:hypothetical protein
MQQAHEIAYDTLKAEITTAFDEYASNPHIIPASWRHIFNHPLDSLLKSERDYLNCWVHSWNEA